MSDAVIVAIIGLCGSGIGSLIGALVSNRVWQYRIEQLEKRLRVLVQLLKKPISLKRSTTFLTKNSRW